MPERQRTLSLHNRQRVRRVDLRLLRRITQALLRETWPQGSFDLAIYVVAEPEMTCLNETYLRHQGSTDVITFDYAEEVAPASGPPLSVRTAGKGANLPYHEAGRSMSPLPATKEWGEGQGENAPTAFALCTSEPPPLRPSAPSPPLEGERERERGPSRSPPGSGAGACYCIVAAGTNPSPSARRDLCLPGRGGVPGAPFPHDLAERVNALRRPRRASPARLRRCC